MAEIPFNTLQAYGKKTAIIAGSFAPNGTAPVAASSRRGLGFTVARSDTGVFTVTLSKPFNKILSATASLQLASAAVGFCTIGATSPSAGTIVINVHNETAYADVAADANNRINFFFVLKNASSTGGYGG
jgi:hypothetical protein